MGSKVSKAKVSTENRPIPTKTKPVTVPRIPQDIIDEILDHLASDSDFGSLRACALVSKSSVQPCRRHLFRTVVFNSTHMDRWLKTFPVPEESPAHHVKDLRICVGGDSRVHERFFKHTRWFTGAHRMYLAGYGGRPLFQETQNWTLPQSVTSLAIDTGVMTLVHVRDIMAQLPNLGDLTLSGSLVAVDGRELLGIGTVLKGRFAGQLILSSECVGRGAIDMLLEIPTGLHFTEVRICCTREHLPSAVRLVEACYKTLVKLSHTVTIPCKSNLFS